MSDEFYDHGAEMASEIPSSEKADGFNQYWNANHKGESGKAEARREYNRGWADYKSGDFDKPRGANLLGLGLVLGLAYLFYRK